MPTGAAPTTSEWSTSLLSIAVRLIIEVDGSLWRSDGAVWYHRSWSTLVQVVVVTGNHVISLNTIDFPSVKSCGIHYRAIPQKFFDYWNTFEIFVFKLQQHRQGANRINHVIRRTIQVPPYRMPIDHMWTKICLEFSRVPGWYLHGSWWRCFYSVKKAYWNYCRSIVLLFIFFRFRILPWHNVFCLIVLMGHKHVDNII